LGAGLGHRILGKGAVARLDEEEAAMLLL